MRAFVRLPQLTRQAERTMQFAALALAAWIAVVGAASRIPERGDFVQFYTLGSIAAAGRYQELFSDRLLHAEQVALTGDVGHYPPVYGPQVALALQPLSWFPFAVARVLLGALGVAVTLWLSLWLVRYRPVLIPWRIRIAVLTIGAPITLYLGITSHLSFVALAALTACAFGLERRSRIIAGIALGLLGYKPSLAVPAIAVVALAGEGTIAGLALAVAVAGPLLALPIVGIDVVQQYGARLWTLAQAPGEIADPPSWLLSEPFGPLFSRFRLLAWPMPCPAGWRCGEPPTPGAEARIPLNGWPRSAWRSRSRLRISISMIC